MYVVDTNVFSNAFKFTKIKSFPTFWYTLEYLLENEIVTSVREVYRELESFFISNSSDNDDVSRWLKNNKKYFAMPTVEDCINITKIFKNKHYRQLIKRQNVLEGKPEGDPFVIAKAMSENKTVVTNEKFKKNAAKIPNVCKAFDVDYIDGDEFFQFVNEYFDNHLKDKYYDFDLKYI